MHLLILLSIFITKPPLPTTNISWYGGYFNGRTTTSGEIFWENKMSVASPTLPMGTVVKFYNHKKWIILVVNDGGPYKTKPNGYAKFPLEPHPTRGFDMSRRAFWELFRDLDVGVARDVRYEIIGWKPRSTMLYRTGRVDNHN